MDCKGDASVDLSGTVGTLKADVRGDSVLREIPDIDLSEDSTAFSSVMGTIEIDAFGDSTLNYRGDAEIIHQRLSGDFKINKRD